MPPTPRDPLRPLLAAAVLALAGCVGLPASPAARAVAPSLAASVESAPLSAREGEITALDDDMRAFLAREVTGHDDLTRLRELIRAVIENADFRVDYGDDTRTAAETFHARRGNCLSFTNLFVALARELGLAVSYQEVDVPPTWTAHDEMLIVSRHINAAVMVRPGVTHVVDFNMPEFRAAYPRRPISDARAAAHFYSNLGVERMQAGDLAAADAYFRRALAMDATLAQAWVNLGAWHRRQGDAARAEASDLAALRLNPREYVAMSNLASLHAHAGHDELAAWYRRRVAQYRLRNPYYRYEQARVAYLSGDFSGATRQLREALRETDTDPTFYSLLGMSYRELGRREEARAAFARAVELADDEDLRSAVRRKLELLGAPSAGL